MKANVFCDDGVIRYCRFQYGESIEEISAIQEIPNENAAELIIPGLVDIHSHGAVGFDNCDADNKGMDAMARYYAQKGVTACLATTMSYGEERLRSVMEAVRDRHDIPGGARCLGINMEGPFINPKKKGAQNGAGICMPDIAMFNRLNEASGKRIKLVDIAPECDGAMEFIRNVPDTCRVSIAHTDSDYDTALAAIDAGADHITHLFNAMPPFMHRAPGVIGAAMDRGAYVEMICDGFHIHPAVVRAAFRMFQTDKICLISDSMRCAGLPDGKYELGGQSVYVRQGKATLEDGTLAGSSIHLMDALKNVISWGVDIETAIRAATMNPADSIGEGENCGRLKTGARADFVILDKHFDVKSVFIAGKAVI